MRVLLTGATGLVGFHTACALLRRGHELSLLVRRPAHFAAHMDRVGGMPDWQCRVALHTGDMLDASAVQQAAQGADGVVHAAAAVSLTARGAGETLHTNTEGTRLVLTTALAAGARAAVHVSSVTVLQDTTAAVVDEQTPLVQPASPYLLSKWQCEQQVRAWQAAGAPVAIVYPSAVVGPADPGLSQANAGMRKFMQGWTPLTTTGFQCIDARDLAEGIVWALEREAGLPAGDRSRSRYIIGGHYLTWAQVRTTALKAGGAWRPPMWSPAPMLRGLGALADALQRVLPFSTSLTAEGMGYATRWVPALSTNYLQTSGLKFRPVDDTFRHTFEAFQSRPSRS